MCSRQQRVHDRPRQLQRLQHAPEQVAVNVFQVRADFVGVQFGGPEQVRDMGQGNLGRNAWLNGKECGLAGRVAGDVEDGCGEGGGSEFIWSRALYMMLRRKSLFSVGLEVRQGGGSGVIFLVIGRSLFRSI